MKKLLKSKKGFKTLITIFAILLIAVTFILFSHLFKNLGKDKEGSAAQFQSIDTEYALRTFLSSPSGIEPEDLKIEVGDHLNNMQLLTRFCDNQDTFSYENFRRNAENYFNAKYGASKWKLEIIYLTENAESGELELSGRSIGSIDTSEALSIYSQYEQLLASTDKSELSKRRVLYALNIRGSRLGMQLLPCIDEGQVVKVVLINSEGKVVYDSIGVSVIV